MKNKKTMNMCYFQLWEESEKGWGVNPDGCSIHISEEEYQKYLSSIYSLRESSTIVPDIYERVLGKMMVCYVSDSLYDVLKSDKSIRLMEYETNNLLKFKEIIIA